MLVASSSICLTLTIAILGGLLKPRLDRTKIIFKEHHIQSAMCPSKSKINSSVLKVYPRDGTLSICADACLCTTHESCVEARSCTRHAVRLMIQNFVQKFSWCQALGLLVQLMCVHTFNNNGILNEAKHKWTCLWGCKQQC